jgi:hypothetical protein
MNPTDQPNTPVVGYCRACGIALTQSSVRYAQGTIYCEEHAPAGAPAAPEAASPYTAPAPPPAGDTSASPGLAFLLGMIPGVGAIYNAQYAKGLVHLVIFGLLISIANSSAASGLEPLFVMVTVGWYFYMPFEAYHTALKRQRGEALDEFSSLFPLKKEPGFPVAPVLLIVVGIIFLLNNLEIVRLYQLLRYWPAFLIALGVYMLYNRMSSSGSEPGFVNREAGHERQ